MTAYMEIMENDISYLGHCRSGNINNNLRYLIIGEDLIIVMVVEPPFGKELT
jgi:hypothetical protein